MNEFGRGDLIEGSGRRTSRGIRTVYSRKQNHSQSGGKTLRRQQKHRTFRYPLLEQNGKSNSLVQRIPVEYRLSAVVK